MTAVLTSGFLLPIDNFILVLQIIQVENLIPSIPPDLTKSNFIFARSIFK